MSTSQSEVEKEGNLTCPVCFQFFNSLKHLLCSHFYCEGCLEKMQVQSKIICPECKMVTEVPTGGVKEFATTNRLVNYLKKKVPGEKKVTYDKCDKDDYSDRDHISLLSCPSNECPESQNVYNPIPLTQEEVMCKEHDYELNHYCETCDEMVCLYCTTKKHNGHKHEVIKNIDCTTHRTQIEATITPVNSLLQDLSDSEDKIVRMIDDIREQGKELNKQIKLRHEELLEMLTKQKDQLKQQVTDTVSQKIEALKLQLNEVNSTKLELLKIKEQNDPPEKKSDLEVLLSKKQIIDDMQQLIDKFNKLSKNPVQFATMKFIPSKNNFPELGSFFDIHAGEVADLPNSIILGQEVEVTVITRDSNGDRCFIGGDNVSVQLISFTGDVSIGKVRDDNNGSYMASFVSEQVGDAKLRVLINGQEIKKSHYGVVVRKYHSLKLPDKIIDNNSQLDEPFGIAFSRTGIWAATDRSKNCVYVFNNHNHLLRKFGSSGRNNGQFNGPRGIAFDEDNHLHVVDNDNHRVQKFDVNGMYLLKFGGRGSHPGQLKDPYGITTHNDRVYVADYSNHRISVFQCDGQFCSCLSSDQLAFPYDVVVNINEQLLVAQYHCHCISTFSLDGQYVSKFGAHGPNEGQINKPYSIATDVHGFILVTDCNHRVSIFDQFGNLTHCFGSHGSRNGQFFSPHAITLSPHGYIYISDTYNKRIQIFSHY